MSSSTGITSLGGSSANATDVQSAAANSITTTKDQFLQMLLAQMKNQDPLSPPDASQFASQMTQFGQLEQLFNVNDNLKGMVDSQQSVDRSQAIGMIGKKIEANGNQVEVASDGTANISFHLDQPADDVKVELKNDSGQTVRTVDYKGQSAGDHFYAFDGKNDLGGPVAPGVYTATVTAQSTQGTAIAANPLVIGTVTSINFQTDGVQVMVGHQAVTMNQILAVAS